MIVASATYLVPAVGPGDQAPMGGSRARAAGVSRQTVSSIETGQYCPSTILVLGLTALIALAVAVVIALGVRA